MIKSGRDLGGWLERASQHLSVVGSQCLARGEVSLNVLYLDSAVGRRVHTAAGPRWCLGRQGGGARADGRVVGEQYRYDDGPASLGAAS